MVETGLRPIVSVVLGSYQRRRFIEPTLRSIRDELRGVPHEIIVVDGGSTDGSLKWLSAQKDVLLIIQHNRGEWMGAKIERRSWGYFMNLGFKAAQGKYVCMLSDDCLVIPGAIRNGVKTFEAALDRGAKVGAVAFYWRNWGQQKDYNVGLTMGHMFVNHGLYLNAALADVGYLDEENYKFYHADGDLCLRMSERGWDCIDSPDSFIEHYPHANQKVRDSNVAVSRSDWEFYSSRWRTIEPKKCYVGRDWIFRSHVDPHSTYKGFPRPNPLRAFVAASKAHLMSKARGGVRRALRLLRPATR